MIYDEVIHHKHHIHDSNILYESSHIHHDNEYEFDFDLQEHIYKNKSITSVSTTRNYPLVCDFNPALPTVAKIINKYKYLLKLDDGLCKIIDPAKIFVSYRGNRKLKDLLVASKPKATNEYISNNPHNKPSLGCFKCDNNCKLCRDFIFSPAKIKSLNCDQEFQFKHKLDCKSPNVIYLIDDLVCNRSSIGSTIIGMSTRWSNHKSHIRKGVKSCEIASHFSNFHNLDKTASISIFDSELKKQLRVTIIDQVVFDDQDSDDIKLCKMKQREAFWQHQLKTLWRPQQE